MKYVNLRDICKINMGQSPESTSYNSDKQGVPFYQGNADFGALYPNPRIWCNKPIKLAKENDILISVRAPVGALNFSKEECCIGRGLAAITLDSNDFLLEFIYWSLRTGVKELQSKSTGSTFKSINKKTLEEVRIPKISLKEQKDIIRNLTLLTNILAKYKHEIVFLDELVKARFVEMFGRPTDKITRYPKVKIANLIKEGKASIKAGPFGSSLKKEFYVKKGFKIYGQEQVIKDDPTFGDYYINEERFNSLKSCEVHAGDILISLVGTCGKTMIMPENFEPGIINPRLLKITFDAEFIIPIYFKYFFGSDDLQKMLNSASGHSTMNVVNASMLKNVELIMAPIELQNQFASFVEEIDKSRLLNICLKSLVESVLKIRIFSEYKKRGCNE